MGWERELKRQERGIDQGQGGFIASAGEGIKSILFFAGSLTFIGFMFISLVGMTFGSDGMGGKWFQADNDNVRQERAPQFQQDSDEYLAERAVNVFLKLNYTGTAKSNCRHFVNNAGVRIVTCRVTGPSQMGTTISKKMNFNIEQTPAGMRVHSVW